MLSVDVLVLNTDNHSKPTRWATRIVSNVKVDDTTVLKCLPLYWARTVNHNASYVIRRANTPNLVYNYTLKVLI